MNKYCTKRNLTIGMMIAIVIAIGANEKPASTPTPQPAHETQSAEPHGRLDAPTIVPDSPNEFGVAILDIQPVLAGTELAVVDLLGR